MVIMISDEYHKNITLTVILITCRSGGGRRLAPSGSAFGAAAVEPRAVPALPNPAYPAPGFSTWKRWNHGKIRWENHSLWTMVRENHRKTTIETRNTRYRWWEMVIHICGDHSIPVFFVLFYWHMTGKGPQLLGYLTKSWENLKLEDFLRSKIRMIVLLFSSKTFMGQFETFWDPKGPGN